MHTFYTMRGIGAMEAKTTRPALEPLDSCVYRVYSRDMSKTGTPATETRTDAPTTYKCWDDSGCDIEIEADSPKEAAQEYVDSGDWPSEPKTQLIRVYVLDPTGKDEYTHDVTIEIEPTEPDCTNSRGHDWKDERVRGNGGGVIITETCSHCGLRRTTDTWAMYRPTGEQGYTTVEYSRDDEEDEEY